MMKIFIIHAHTANRGDEAAVKAMVDELLIVKPDTEITIAINGRTFYPAMDPKVKQIGRFPALHSVMAKIEYPLFIKTCGKICFTPAGKNFKKALLEADLVIHAPGGPSIGDIYSDVEKEYLDRLGMARRLGKRYMFYAPSMGPFKDETRNPKRKEILIGAQKVILRDPISFKFVQEFCPKCHPQLALDSAFQHEVDECVNRRKLEEYTALKKFMTKHEKNVGVTITDLQWHPQYKETAIAEQIKTAFRDFVAYLDRKKYGVVFIPQLYGSGDDSTLMKEFETDNNGFVIEANLEKYDTYFQQYVIKKLTAVVGMRYHSNIFSAKMSVPFVSISYEQKMRGFMESMDLMDYCIRVDDISADILKNHFERMLSNYTEYKNLLVNEHKALSEKAYRSTQAVINILNNQDENVS